MEAKRLTKILEVRESTIVKINNGITISFADGKISLPVEIKADLKDIPDILHTEFLNLLRANYKREIIFYSGVKNMDGSLNFNINKTTNNIISKNKSQNFFVKLFRKFIVI